MKKLTSYICVITLLVGLFANFTVFAVETETSTSEYIILECEDENFNTSTGAQLMSNVSPACDNASGKAFIRSNGALSWAYTPDKDGYYTFTIGANGYGGTSDLQSGNSFKVNGVEQYSGAVAVSNPAAANFISAALETELFRMPMYAGITYTIAWEHEVNSMAAADYFKVKYEKLDFFILECEDENYNTSTGYEYKSGSGAGEIAAYASGGAFIRSNGTLSWAYTPNKDGYYTFTIGANGYFKADFASGNSFKVNGVEKYNGAISVTDVANFINAPALETELFRMYMEAGTTYAIAWEHQVNSMAAADYFKVKYEEPDFFIIECEDENYNTSTGYEYKSGSGAGEIAAYASGGAFIRSNGTLSWAYTPDKDGYYTFTIGANGYFKADFASGNSFKVNGVEKYNGAIPVTDVANFINAPALETELFRMYMDAGTTYTIAWEKTHQGMAAADYFKVKYEEPDFVKIECEQEGFNTSDPFEFKNDAAAAYASGGAFIRSNGILSWVYTPDKDGYYTFTIGANGYGGTSNLQSGNSFKVNGVEQYNGAIPAGNANFINAAALETELFCVTMYAGETYTITWEHEFNSQAAADYFKVKYEELTESITEIPASFAVNKNTVSGTTADSADVSDTAVTLQTDKYFEYKIVTKTAKKYKLSVAVASAVNDSKLDVYVNDVKQLDAASVSSGSLGNITLDVGTNTLKFYCPAGGGFAVSEFTLDDVTEEITSDPVEFDVNLNTISATDVADNYLAVTYATTLLGRYFEYEIATEKTGNYTLTVDAATKEDGGLLDVFVNGQKQINDAAITNNGTYDTYAANELGTITLTPGTNTIRVFGEYANTIRINKLTLSADNATDIRFTGFELQAENGVRPPYIVKDNMDVYAVAEFERIADSDSDNLYLFVAQYTDKGALVDATYTTVDLANLALYEPEQFKTKVTLKGETGSVKAYLMKEKDFSPVTEKIGYSEVTIFDDSLLDTVFNETPVYTLATNVKNSAGEYYADYSIHDSNYDIDAIFYDSVVGKQTKVFAYVGVPKGASEANPVPAVVLIHGGAGIAYADWVKNWNDKGVAAIAMSLAGDGPDATGADTAHHPYRGIDCWGEPIAFKADLENAGMYQNALTLFVLTT